MLAMDWYTNGAITSQLYCCTLALNLVWSNTRLNGANNKRHLGLNMSRIDDWMTRTSGETSGTVQWNWTVGTIEQVAIVVDIQYISTAIVVATVN